MLPRFQVGFPGLTRFSMGAYPWKDVPPQWRTRDREDDGGIMFPAGGRSPRGTDPLFLAERTSNESP